MSQYGLYEGERWPKNEKLEVPDLPTGAHEVLDRVITNAKAYYASDVHRDHVDGVLDEYSRH